MTTGLRVSSGQACINALADLIRSQLPSDVNVIAQWPEPSVQLFAPASRGMPAVRATVSLTKIGRRERLDVAQAMAVESRVDFTPPTAQAPTAQVAFRIGSLIQPIQVDIWATNEDDRDDLIDRLDDVFTMGAALSLAGNPAYAGVTDDPVRDGVLVALRAKDGYSGTADCWFDEPDITQNPDGVQVAEYRATYFGHARADFTRTRIVPRLIAPELKAQSYEGASVPSLTSIPYDTTTITVQSNTPPPGPKVTRGTSTT
jgi:hypothetical protein